MDDDVVHHADAMELNDELEELKDDHWLSCDVINQAQSLLKKQFPRPEWAPVY